MKVFKMAGALMKAWRSKPVTLMYPDTEAKCFENTRGSIAADIEKCTMCGICAENCPAAAIEIDKDKEQWSIYRMQCVLCGQCVELCPEGCLYMSDGYSAAENEKIQDVYYRAESEAEDDSDEVQDEEDTPEEAQEEDNSEKEEKNTL